MSIERVSLHESAPVTAPAAELWDLITDWAGMMRWWLPAELGGLGGPALVGCELIGTEKAVPRSRRMLLSDGASVVEQVIYQDDDARRVYYTKSADIQMTGYLATTFVDEVDEKNSTVHIASSLDVTPGADPSAVAAKYSAIYQAMFRGYQRFFA